MNEEQTKILLKKSALETTENFTDNLMEQIETKSIAQVRHISPSISRVFLTIAAIVLLLSFLIFYTNFTFLSELEIIKNTHRTKLFIVLLFAVLLGVNHVLKIEHNSKLLSNNMQ